MKTRVVVCLFFGIFLVSAFPQKPTIMASPQAAQSTHTMNFERTPLGSGLDLLGELTGRTIWLHPAQKHTEFTHEAKNLTGDKIVRELVGLFADKGVTFTEGPAGLLVAHPDSLKVDVPEIVMGQPTDEAKRHKHGLNFQMTPMETFVMLYDKLTKEEVYLKASEAWMRYHITFVPRKEVPATVAIQQMEALLHMNGVTMKKDGNKLLLSIPETGLVAPMAAPTHRTGRKPQVSHADVQKHLQKYQMEVVREGLPLLPPTLSGEEVERLKKRKAPRITSDPKMRQEYQMELIRKGLPLLPIALTKEQIEQLKKEGFGGDQKKVPNTPAIKPAP